MLQELPWKGDTHLLEKFSNSCGIRMSITVSTEVSLEILSRVRSCHTSLFRSSKNNLSIAFPFIPRSSNWSFSLGILTNILCAFIFFICAACPAHRNFFSLISLIDFIRWIVFRGLIMYSFNRIHVASLRWSATFLLRVCFQIQQILEFSQRV